MEMQSAKWNLPAALALVGFSAVTVQITLMRELIVVFSGNEISLGLMLANWLLWTALGSGLLGGLATVVPNPRLLLAGLQGLVALLFPATIYAVRASRSYLQVAPGELLGPGPMYLTSFAALSLICLAMGCMFATGSRCWAEEAGSSMAAATGSVYLLEALGSGLGGLVAGVVLLPHLHAFQIAMLVALANLLAAAGLGIKPGVWRRAAMAVIVAAGGFVLFPLAAPQLEQASLARLWQGFRLIDSRNSRYGNLVVVETEGSRSLYENGLVAATVPDAAAAEEAVHFALLEHPEPRRLLLVGGGINGSLQQALQHPSLEQVDYVELDPAVLDIAERHFGRQWALARADPRVRIHPLDGRLFLKTSHETFDVVIINLPEPLTAQLNRFYTEEFCREAARRLAPGGILSFQLPSSENYISPERASFFRCLNATLRRVFPQVVALPGETVHFLAARQAGVLTMAPEVLVARLRARHLQTSYVREYYLPFRLSLDRQLDLQQQIEPQAETPLNRDFAPRGYFLNVELASARFHRGQTGWLAGLERIQFRTTLFIVVMGMLALSLLATAVYGRQPRADDAAAERIQSSGKRAHRVVAGMCVAAMGFTLIALEILLLLGFQALFGYVYQQLAVVIAAFMAGMALGAWRATRSLAAGPVLRAGDGSMLALRAVAILQFSAALAPILLYALLAFFAGLQGETALWMVGHIAFPLVALVGGLLGGYQFPLASRVYFAGSRTRSPGVLYGLDLAGACVGAVVLSAFLFPLYGFLRSAILIAVVSLAPALLAALPVAAKGVSQD
jgi:spermidine synthase